MDGLVVRKATIDDLEILLEFEQGVIQSEKPFDPTLKEGPIHYYDLHSMIASSHIHLVVAEFKCQLIGSGYARIEASEPFLQHAKHAYLGFMYVIPSFRGKGINQAIVNELEAWAKKKSITELRLEVYFQNTIAIRAYEKAGFSSHMIEMRKGL